jgi:hypothetical protein
LRADNDLIAVDSETSLVDLTAPPDGSDGNAPGLIAPDQRTASSAAALRRSSQPPDYKAVLEQLTLFLAPTSLVTGLFYWIGWSFTNAYWSAFAVDHALLHYSTTDYLLRSMTPAYPFVTMLLISAIVLIVIHRSLVRARTHIQPFTLQIAEWVIRVLGLFFATVALADVFPRELSRLDLVHLASSGTLVGPTLGALGGLCLAYASNLRAHTFAAVQRAESPECRRLRRLLTGLAAGLVVLAIFLLADRYTSYYGTAWARYQAEHSESLPVVSLYSHQRLGITAKGTQETGDAASGFRYTGLRLLRYAGKTYFLLPSEDRRILLLPESSGFRVELSRP